MVRIVNGEIVREGDVEAGTAGAVAASSSSPSPATSNSTTGEEPTLFVVCGCFKITKWILGGALLMTFLLGGFPGVCFEPVLAKLNSSLNLIYIGIAFI
jgi:hypothetical protein